MRANYWLDDANNYLKGLFKIIGEGLTITTSDGEIHIDFEIKSGKQIKLSIDAPDEVGVWRDELEEEAKLLARESKQAYL